MEDKKIIEPETMVVNINENYSDLCLQDSVNSIDTKTRKPEGYVEIYSIDKDGKKELVGKSNLVLFAGREWLASRLCNIKNPDIGQDETEFLSWFGLGDGGSVTGDPLTPTVPTNIMTSLSNEIPISYTDVTYADYRPAVGASAYYKHPFDSVGFEQDPANENKYLILKVTTTITTLDANGFDLSEAGLYTSNSDAGEFGGPFNIFSIVTFPSIRKDDSRQLVFYWYLYC